MVFTRDWNWSVSWVRWIRFLPQHPFSLYPPNILRMIRLRSMRWQDRWMHGKEDIHTEFRWETWRKETTYSTFKIVYYQNWSWRNGMEGLECFYPVRKGTRGVLLRTQAGTFVFYKIIITWPTYWLSAFEGDCAAWSLLVYLWMSLCCIPNRFVNFLNRS